MYRSIVRLLTVVTLLFADASSTIAQTICNSPSCLYAPFVSRPTPVWVSSITKPFGCPTYKSPPTTNSCVAGEFFNSLTQPLSSVVVRTRFFDDQQREEVVTKTVSFPALMPNEIFPFRSSTLSQTYRYVEASIVDWTVLTSTPYRSLTVVMTKTVEAPYVDGWPGTKFIAYLRNDQAQTLTDVQIAIWVSNDILTSGEAWISPIAPGQTISISALFQSQYLNSPFKAVAIGKIQSR